MHRHDRVLLDEGDGVVADPVEHQPRGEAAQHEHEHPGHPGEDHRLARVGRRRVQLLLEPHRDAEQDRQHAEREHEEHRARFRRGEGQQAEEVQDRRRIGRGQVADPADEGRVIELDGDVDHLVEREEDRDLQQHRQTACGRVDLLALVEGHHLLLHLLRVALGALFHRLHLGLQLLHLRHRDVGFARQREDQGLDDDGEPDDRPAHCAGQVQAVRADRAVQPVQQAEHRLRQEEEPAPVDRVDKAGDAGVVLVVLDHLPLLRTGEEAGFGDGRGARGNLHHRQAGLGLIEVGTGGVFDDRGEGPVRRDQRRHPVLVGEADPAVFACRDQLGLALAGDGVELGQVLVLDLFERVVGHPHRTFVQHIDAVALRNAVAGDDAIGGKTHRRAGVVLDALGDGEEVVVINRDRAGEAQARAVVPAQRDRGLRGQHGIGGRGPQRLRPGHQRRVEPAGGRPAIDRVIGLGVQIGAPHRGKQPHQGRVGLERFLVFPQRQVVEAAAEQRDRAGERRRVDADARGIRVARLRRGRRGVEHGAGHGLGRCRGRGRGGGLCRNRGAVCRGRGLRREEVGPTDQHERREDGRDDEVLVLAIHGGPSACRSGFAVVQSKGRRKVKRFSPKSRGNHGLRPGRRRVWSRLRRRPPPGSAALDARRRRQLLGVALEPVEGLLEAHWRGDRVALDVVRAELGEHRMLADARYPLGEGLDADLLGHGDDRSDKALLIGVGVDIAHKACMDTHALRAGAADGADRHLAGAKPGKFELAAKRGAMHEIAPDHLVVEARDCAAAQHQAQPLRLDVEAFELPFQPRRHLRVRQHLGRDADRQRADRQPDPLPAAQRAEALVEHQLRQPFAQPLRIDRGQDLGLGEDAALAVQPARHRLHPRDLAGVGGKLRAEMADDLGGFERLEHLGGERAVAALAVLHLGGEGADRTWPVAPGLFRRPLGRGDQPGPGRHRRAPHQAKADMDAGREAAPLHRIGFLAAGLQPRRKLDQAFKVLPLRRVQHHREARAAEPAEPVAFAHGAAQPVRKQLQQGLELVGQELPLQPFALVTADHQAGGVPPGPLRLAQQIVHQQLAFAAQWQAGDAVAAGTVGGRGEGAGQPGDGKRGDADHQHRVDAEPDPGQQHGRQEGQQFLAAEDRSDARASQGAAPAHVPEPDHHPSPKPCRTGPARSRHARPKKSAEG
ncbi:hypothetical protein SDC9_21394 [bioreactor metagenome]|uniref:Uncharacterized protein n=1 Tax=bioreactor metagenome TaxID=1076179 RepID=A0A644U9E9_9ZZZZ